jgi:hypothetical protein
MRLIAGVGACLAVVGLVLLIAFFGGPAKPGGTPITTATGNALATDPRTFVKGPVGGAGGAEVPVTSTERGTLPDLHSDPATTVYIGHDYDPKTPREVQTVLTTRRRDATYQALVRYRPQMMQSSEIPGVQEVRQALAAEGKTLPSQIRRVDQETEMFMDNLGQPLHSIMSYMAYVNIDGRVVAYDLAQSSGGVAERLVGHLTRKGAIIDIYRGGQRIDTNEVTFPNMKTFIPVEMELIPQWYQTHNEMLERKEPVLFSLFMPEVMGFILLKAKPLDDQVIPIADATWNCARYEVWTSSMQSNEGQKAHQIMWFDKQPDSGLLMRVEDIDPSLKPGEGPVTERRGVEELAHLRQSFEVVPELPKHDFPYPLGQTLLYTVHNGDQEIGHVHIKFDPVTAEPEPEAAIKATAVVDIGASGNRRHEGATTIFNKNFEALRYTAVGQESNELTTDYSVEAKIAAGQLAMSLTRHTPPPVVLKKTEAAPNPNAPKDQFAELWPSGSDPLHRVPINDEDAKSEEDATAAPKDTRQQITRPLTKGTFLFDHNRLEQLAALAYRLPLPDLQNKDAPRTLYQKAGLCFVRQNRAGIVLFEITPEPKPVLTDRQKQREALETGNEPQLFVANVSSAMMPCSMLLAPDGRILELTLKLGAKEITYTLDDPIMRRRAERAKREKMKQGPRLLRPEWW